MGSRRARSVLCLLALLPLAGCVDALLDGGEAEEVTGPDVIVTDGGNATNGTDADAWGPWTPWAGSSAPVAPTPGTPAPPAATTPEPAAPAPPAPAPPPVAPPPPTPASPVAPPPAPTPVTQPTQPTPPQPQAWPREGSFVTYAASTHQSFSGSPQGHDTYVNVTWTYRNGDWRAVCEGNRHNTDPDGGTTIEPIRAEMTSASPPHWPPMNTRDPPPVGTQMTVWHLRGCSLDEDQFAYAGTDTETATVNGQPTLVETHRARHDESNMPYVYDAEWSQDVGLVLHWSLQRVMTQAPFSTTGRLTDTDAPL